MRTDEAIEFFGSASNLAKAIGITPGAVTQWPDLVPKSRRASVRMAMRERADELTKEARRLRIKAKED